MKTKFLLFALLMLLPWCAKAQMQETVYRVSLTDLPEDLNMEDLDVRMMVDNGTYTSEFPMIFDTEAKSFYLSSTMYSELHEVSEAKLWVKGSYFVTTDTLDWQMKAEQEIQEMNVSLKSYRKVFFDIENGWNFYEVSSSGQYYLRGFSVFKKSGGDRESYNVGGVGSMVTSPEQQNFYLYAEPGEYLFEGEILRCADNFSVRLQDQPLTIPNEGKAFVGLDWENNTLVSFNLKNVVSDVEYFTISLYDSQAAEEGGVEGMEISGQNGVACAFLPVNRDYIWISEISSYSPRYYEKRGTMTTNGKEQSVEIDYSDFVKQTFVFKGIEDYRDAQVSVDLNQAEYSGNSLDFHLDEESTTVDVYLPKDKYSIYASFYVIDQESTTYYGYPLAFDISVDEEKDIDLDITSYHKVNFLCAGETLSADVCKEEDKHDIMVNGRYLLLPDGDYIAYGYYQPDEVDLKKNFTISGTDMVVDFEYNPDDYTNLTIQVDNMGSLPAFIDAYCFVVNVFQDGKEVDYLSIYETAQGYIVSKKLKKGTYTYKGGLENYEADGILIPTTGTLVLSDAEQTLKFDMNDFCFAPLEITDEHQKLIGSLYFMLGDDEESIDYLKQPNAYIMALPGTYPITFFAARHENQTQNIELSKQTEKLSFTMKQADVYPLFISLENFNWNVAATITVEGVGSYQLVDDEFVGSLLPFMSVKAGTYKLTVSAPGYETHTQMIEVNEANYDEYQDAVHYEIYMRKAGSSVENVLQNNSPLIKIYQNRIFVETEDNSRIMVYNMSGVCVASVQGKQMMTEALPSGIYIVKTASATGTNVKKVAVGK